MIGKYLIQWFDERYRLVVRNFKDEELEEFCKDRPYKLKVTFLTDVTKQYEK